MVENGEVIAIESSGEHMHDDATAKLKGIPGLRPELKQVLTNAVKNELLSATQKRRLIKY